MKQVLTAAFVAAGLAAFGAQAGADELRVPAQPHILRRGSRRFPPTRCRRRGLALGPARHSRAMILPAAAIVMPVVYGGAVLPQSFAASTALSMNLALDAGYNLDLGQRFDNYAALKSPLLDQTSFLGLANGGTYAGVTYAPAPNLRLRLGAQLKSNRLDSFTFDPTLGMHGLPLAYDNGASRSLLAGVSWDFADWAGLDLSGIVNQQQGQPVGASPLADLTPGSTRHHQRAQCFGAYEFRQRLGDHRGLQRRPDPARPEGRRARHDRQPFLFDRHRQAWPVRRTMRWASPSAIPAPACWIMASKWWRRPAICRRCSWPMTACRAPTPETDLQLGYVTSFLDGALALQANAAYQMNYQGQTGATSLAVLSRAKIKF